MSGPKGISYALQQEVLERLRRREESLADLRAADSRLQGLITRCDDLGHSHIVAASLRAGTQQPGEETPTDVVTARAVSVRKSVEGLSKQLEDTLALERRRSLSASLGALAAQLPSSVGAEAQEVTVAKPAEVIAEPSSGHNINADTRDKRARVEEVLADLKMPVGDLAVLANAAITAKPLRHEALLGQLRSDVRRANDLYDRAAAVSHNSLGLTAQLEEEELPPGTIAAQSLVKRIDEAGYSHSLAERVADAEKSVGDCLQRVDRMKSVRDSERARAFVEDAVKESFAALGYAVTDLDPTVTGGTVLSAPSSKRHGVQIAVDGSEIAVRSVRIAGPGDGASDMAADVELCDSIAALTPLLGDAGVTLRRIRSVPPGIVPAPVVSAGKATAGRGAVETAGSSPAGRKKSTQRLGKTL